MRSGPRFTGKHPPPSSVRSTPTHGPTQSRPHWTGNWCGCLTRIGCGPAP
nr:MAG TPA: hypothetical protein [Caudoviricetes sp.]